MQTLEHKWGIQVYVRGVETTPSGTATGYASDLLAACPNMTFEGKPISNFLMVVVLMHPGPGSPTKHQDTIIYGTQAGSYPNDLSAIRADMESNLGAHHQYVQAVATAMSYINDVLSGKPDPAIHHNPTWETVLKWIAVIAIIVVAILAAIFGKGSSGGRRGYYYVGGGSTGGSTPSTGSSGATSGGFN